MAGKEISVFVVDDDPVVRTTIAECLRNAGMIVTDFPDAESALDRMTGDVDVMLLDLCLPQTQGHQCLRMMRRQFPATQVVMISGSEQVIDIVSSIQLGAVDYLQKPVDADVVVSVTRKAALKVRAPREDSQACSTQGSEFVLGGIQADLQRAAELKSPVLILGESGTGKSLAAKWIHEHSERNQARLVPLNCASLPSELAESELFGHAKGAFTGADRDREGKVEVADGGTLFLDEIGDLSIRLQPKLLTFLQDKQAQRVGSNKIYQCDVRIIAATHRNLSDMCRNGDFREDLFYRLNVLQIVMPPLRSRIYELPDLVSGMLKRICERFERDCPVFDSSLIDALGQHSWPGNLRELENVLERAVAFLNGDLLTADEIRISHIPVQEAGATPDPGRGIRTLKELEKEAIELALRRCEGNKALTARQLGVSEKTIYNKIRRHGITVPN